MKQWSLNQKIWSIIGLLVMAYVVSSYMALTNLENVRNDMNELTGPYMQRDQLTSEIKDNQRVLSSTTMRSILQKDPAKLALIEKKFDDTEEKQKRDIEDYNKLASEKGKEILAKYMAAFTPYVTAAAEAKKLGVQNKAKEATDIFMTAEEKYLPEMRKYIDELNELTSSQLKTKSEQSNNGASFAIRLVVMVAVFSISLSLIIAFFVLRAVTAAIKEVISNLFDSSAEVSSAAGQVSAASEELSQASTEQAASLQETASSIEEMNSMVNKNTENAQMSALSSKNSKENASKGKHTVEQMILSIDDINKSNNHIMDQINHSNSQISEIVKVIAEIGIKTKVINDIVFQTKLLSFNASVEAARAGEHGKGFAVVAEEVGNLAQMSGNAALEITTMLDESINKVERIVNETKTNVTKSVEEGRKKVELGTKIAQECGVVLDDIVVSIESVSTMSEEIYKASLEQSQGIGEITKAMHVLDQVTLQNTTTSEQSASAASELSAQADSLNGLMQNLVAAVLGSSAASTDINSSQKSQKNQSRKTSKPNNAFAKEKTMKFERTPAAKDTRFVDA